VVRDLRAQGIHCTSEGANAAGEHGYWEVVQDLAAHGIFVTRKFVSAGSFHACSTHTN